MPTRRQILSGIGGLSLAAGTGINSVLSSIAAHAIDTSGYKALVCVFLRGGLDCHDTIMPVDQSSYDQFSTVRQDLLTQYASAEGVASTAISRARTNLLELTPSNGADFGSRAFGLPPQMSGLHGLFHAGKAAIIGNVGPLVEPTSRAQYEAKTVQLPARLFSHNDQQSTWVSSATEGAESGWGGKFADAAIAAGANADPMFSAITLDKNSVFLTGETARQYAAGADVDGAYAPSVYELENTAYLWRASDATATQAKLDALFRNSKTGRSNLFQRDLIDAANRAIDANTALNTILETAPTLATSFPDTSLGHQLKAAADIISVRGSLGAGRQVFLASTGGFDTHSDQASDLPDLQSNLDAAITAFYNATVELGIADSVTLFTVADFGRTLAVNGDGTDHGWGGHHFAVGGAVNGGTIFGDVPEFNLDHSQAAGKGRLIPTTSVSQYAATLGRWFGLTDTELAAAFPGLARFPDGPLGFV